MTELRFHFDECVDGAVPVGLRRQGIDVTQTPGAIDKQAGDAEQLAFAFREGRVLVSQDSDFLRLADEGHPHAGIAYYAPGTRSVGQLIERLALMHAVLTPEEMVGQIEYL